jgi:uncharacterized protein (TIGR02147 family)
VGERLSSRICDRLSASPDTFVRVTPKTGPRPARYSFTPVSKWYCYALLELTRTRGFRPEERWIARALGISVHQVREAKKQLLAIGFLEIDDDGRWHDRSGSATTSYTSPALRALQRQVLELSRAKLETVDIAHRDHSSLILRFESGRLEEAREAITAFRREFDRRFGADEGTDSVYLLGINFVPLTQLQGEKS